MEIKDCIGWLEHFKKYWNEFNINTKCLIVSDKDSLDNIDEIIKRLKILEELKKSISPGGVIEIEYHANEPLPDISGIRFVFEWLNKLEEKYFPPTRKTTSLDLKITGKDDDVDEFYRRINKLEDFMREKKMAFTMVWDKGEDD